MKRKSAPPTPPADMVRGKTSEEAIRILLKQIDRFESKAAGLLMDADPDPEESDIVIRHLDALRAELLNQERREAAMN